jgi:thiamine biosynthesis protein ThiI
MMPNKQLVVHFGELWLRGKNRGNYIKSLTDNLAKTLAGLHLSIRRSYDRILIEGSEPELEQAYARLGYVFGISNYEMAYATRPELGEITRLAVELAKQAGAKSIKVNAHRSFKQLSFDSMQIVKSIEKEARANGINASLRNFDKEVYVNVTKDAAYIFTEKKKGLGGLPVGSEGTCIVLISGGIDSPVAAWFAMKRGLKPIYLHLHAFQSNEEAANGKVASVAALLSKYYPAKFYFAPSYFFDAAAVAGHTGRCTLVLLKHFMLRLAEKIAEKEHAKAIVTGESLGQVASQTLENLSAESSRIKLPILRPLIGFDKEEIIGFAKKIGTYDISILPYKDVCSIEARNPRTKCKQEEVLDLAGKIKLGSVIRRTLAKMSVKEYASL